MGIVCFFNAQHHKYQVQELLGLLSKYLKVESKTLRTGPVLQEELRALRFLHKSARVHINEQNTTVKEGEGSVKIGKRATEEKERERKRPKYIRPFTTTVPLDMSIDIHATEGAKDTSAPIPLPLAHRQLLQTPGTSRTFGTDFNLGMGMNDSNGITHTQSPFHFFPNVPSVLQSAIKDYSYGDQDLTAYADYALPILYPQITNQQFDPSSLNMYQAGTNGINPTPSRNTDANLFAALSAYAAPVSNGTVYGQVLGNMDTAGAQIGEISPPSSLGDLPGTTNQHLAMQGYEGYGYPTGLGVQLGHTPTSMHAGTYYNTNTNAVMAHPQPHVYTQQPQLNQFLQPPPQTQIQAMRRQSFPQQPTYTQLQGQRWSEGMILQNGVIGSGTIPQTQEAVKVARSNSMWATPSKQP
jgi:hypothetical protein